MDLRIKCNVQLNLDVYLNIPKKVTKEEFLVNEKEDIQLFIENGIKDNIDYFSEDLVKAIMNEYNKNENIFTFEN